MYIRGILDKEIYCYLNDNELFFKCGYLYLFFKIYKIKDNILIVFMNGICSFR